MTAVRFSALAALLLVGWEWLFYATKPSLLSGADFSVYACALLLPGLLLALLAALPVQIVHLVSRRAAAWLGALIGGVLLGVTSLIVVDSMLYGGLGVGSLYTDGALRVAALVGFLGLTLRWIWVGLKLKSQSDWRLIAILVGLFALIIFCRFKSLTPRDLSLSASSIHAPNIILFGSDGLDTAEMEVFNRALNNTPTLTRLSGEMLICEKAYSNANRSAGSVVSMLTGRLPFETRVVNYPDLLLPGLAYDHLPGILRKAGYYTYESSMRGYADSFDLNLRDGFIEANGRMLSEYELPILSRYQEIFASFEYNLGLVIVNDVLNRLRHLLFIDSFKSIFRLVKTGEGLREIDNAGVDRLINLMKNDLGGQPIFAHMHLLGTHGPGFKPKRESDTPYRAAIFDYDDQIERLFAYLEESKKIKNTMVVIYSDHDSKNSPISEVPLLVYFPGGALGGVRRAECQLLDVAPTVLRAAGLETPSFMSGRALLDELKPAPIFCASDVESVEVWNYKKPPYFQFGGAGVVQCGVVTSVKFPSLEAVKIGEPWCSGALFGDAAIEQLIGFIGEDYVAKIPK